MLLRKREGAGILFLNLKSNLAERKLIPVQILIRGLLGKSLGGNATIPIDRISIVYNFHLI